MIFNFKKSKITVDCFTYDETVYQLHKIRSAKLYYPELIKNMPNDLVINDPNTGVEIPLPTIKRCTGINELYKHGAIIPFWLDYVCTPANALAGKSRLGVTDDKKMPTIAEHPPKQFEGLFNDYVHIKFGGVWNIVEKTGVKFLWNPATYNLNNHIHNFIVPPAVTFYDWQCQTNLNMFVRKDSPNFTLTAGTPIVHIIPLTEKEVEYKCHQVTYEEWCAKNTIPLGFPTILGTRNIAYWKLRRQSLEMDALEKKGKCPFGFGR